MNESLHILIIEDNPADVELLRDALQESGAIRFNCESVPRLSEALARLAAGGIELVISDLGLPDSQGLATFRMLHQEAPDLAIIVLTGNEDEEMALTAVREGAQDFLIKGRISESLLVRSVRYAMERKQAEEEKEKLIAGLSEALENIKTLKGLLPICTSCKKIRNDTGYWERIEVYIRDRSDAEFTHSICPECTKKLYPDLYDKTLK